MRWVISVGSIALAIMIMLFPSSLLSAALKEAKGQLLPSCPIGYQRNVLGTCEPVSNLQTCPVGYQRSASGICVPISSSQTCPVGYQMGVSGVCVPITGSIGVNPYTPQTTVTQPQPTFTQPSSSTGLMSPTLTSPPSGGEMSPWFPSLPAIACGGTSADHESVDGTVFAGEKNIERNNGRDFDIRDVFNDCQVSMFND